jgi:hypothetical protein
MAISEATSALQLIAPEISLSRDYCYQFANRIAFAWKIASTGVPVAMIYLGFIGDARIISHIDDCFMTPGSGENHLLSIQADASLRVCMIVKLTAVPRRFGF